MRVYYTVCEYKTTMDSYKAVYNTIRTLIIVSTYVRMYIAIYKFPDLRNLEKYNIIVHTYMLRPSNF